MEDLDIKARHYESYYNQKSTWDETLEIKHFKE